MLEVMQPARRGKDGESKSLPQTFVEKRLEAMINAGGENRINAFRDSVRLTAEELGMYEEFDKLNAIISALLSTHNAEEFISITHKAMSTCRNMSKCVFLKGSIGRNKGFGRSISLQFGQFDGRNQTWINDNLRNIYIQTKRNEST